jgi:hypothetical protein
MAGIAVAENDSYLARIGLVCDNKADLSDHDVANALDLGKSGKRIRNRLK